MKKIKTSLLLVTLTLAASTALAGSFSRGGGSFSRGAVSAPRSIGFSRPAPTPSVAPRPSYAAPLPTTSPSYSSQPAPRTVNNTTVIHRDGGGFGGGGGGFLSSMAGGAAGSILGNLISQPHHAPVVVSGGAVAAPAAVPVQPYAGATAAAPGVVGAVPYVVAQPSAGSQILSFLGWLAKLILMLGLLAALTYAIWWLARHAIEYHREQEQEREDASKDPYELPFSPVAKFIAVQKAFAARDVAALRTHLSEDLVEQTLDDLPPEGSMYTLSDISYAVLQADDFAVTILFTAVDKSDGSALREKWHFRRVISSWVLAGIEQ